MHHLHHVCSAALLGVLAALPSSTWAQTADAGFYATVYAQASRLDSTTFDEVGTAGFGTGLKAAFDTGFGLGGDVGYRYGNGWAAEVEWNWRRHELASLRRAGTAVAGVTEGDFASNIIFVNGLRRFTLASERVVPYVGVGLGWVQEIDFDLNSATLERAWSDQGEAAVQVMGGAEFAVGDVWRLTADLRLLQIGDVELPAEEGVTGRLSKPEYNPLSVQVGLRRQF
jgi:Outer membrane protein beta-barrel domain